MSFLGDLMGGEQKPAPASPAPYVPTPSNATILTEGMDKTKHPNPDLVVTTPTHIGIRG